MISLPFPRTFFRPHLFLLLGAPLTLQAQETSPVLPEVQVNDQAVSASTYESGFAASRASTGTKSDAPLIETPRAVSVVTRDEMDSRQVTSLQETVQTAAGVSAANYGRRGIDDVFIRGFRATESTLINGLPQSASIYARTQPYGFERVEVLKGASSILYGQVQPGGIINGLLKQPKPAESFSEIGFNVGSYGLREIFADINRPFENSERGAFRVNASYSDANDPTHYVYDRHRWLAPSVSLDLGPDTDLTLFFTYNQAQFMRQQGLPSKGTVLDNPNGKIDAKTFTGEPYAGNYDVTEHAGGYQFQHRFSPNLTLRHSFRYENESGKGNFTSLVGTLKSDYFTQARQQTQQDIDSNILAQDTSLLSKFTTGMFEHTLVTGLDARSSDDSLAIKRCALDSLNVYAPTYGMSIKCPNTYATDAPTTIQAVGLYAQDSIQLAKKWTFLMGTRYETANVEVRDHVNSVDQKQTNHKWRFSGGVLYALAPELSLYSSYSESFLPVSGVDVNGNAFQPETGRQVEAGLKYALLNKRLVGNLSVFNLHRENVTVSDPANSGYSIQTGQERARGVEFELAADLSHGFKSVFAYSYTDAEVVKDTNTALIGKSSIMQPKHYATWWNYYTHAATRMTYGWGLRTVGAASGPQTFQLPGYTVFDLSAGYLGKDYKITAGIKNVFDRNYYVGSVNENVVSPGDPRRLQLTLTYFLP